MNCVLGIAAVEPQPTRSGINVMVAGAGYWPLPWYLRGFKDVNWSAGGPEEPYAPPPSLAPFPANTQLVNTP